MDDSPCPSALLEMQRWFAEIITSPLHELDEANLPIYSSGLIDEIRRKIEPSPTLKSEERMGIYHQQYWWRLVTIMQELYPSLVRIFDYDDFNLVIATPYLLAYPPHDWFLSRIGSDLPGWLQENYRESDAPLVLGLAQLDLAYERLMFVDLSPPIDPGRCEEERLYLQPSVNLFHLGADFFTLRTQLLEQPAAHWKEHDLPQINTEEGCFVLFRQYEKSFYERVSPSRFELLKRFQQGATLKELIPLMEECEEVVDWFSTIASRGWLTYSEDL